MVVAYAWGMADFGTILTAVVTPFDANGAVDEAGSFAS